MSNQTNIQKAIDELVIYTELGNLQFNEEIAFAQEKLQEALNSCNKFNEKSDFENYVHQDCDPIGRAQTEQISKYESIVEKVRDIQNDIADEFVQFGIAYMQ